MKLTNEEATEALIDSANGWVTSLTAQDAKPYRYELENKTVATSYQLKFLCSAPYLKKIPEKQIVLHYKYIKLLIEH